MKSGLILLKYAILVFGLENFYCIDITTYDVRLQGVWNRSIINYALSLGAKPSRYKSMLTLQLTGLRLVMDYRGR